MASLLKRKATDLKIEVGSGFYFEFSLRRLISFTISAMAGRWITSSGSFGFPSSSQTFNTHSPNSAFSKRSSREIPSHLANS